MISCSDKSNHLVFAAISTSFMNSPNDEALRQAIWIETLDEQLEVDLGEIITCICVSLTSESVDVGAGCISI